MPTSDMFKDSAYDMQSAIPGFGPVLYNKRCYDAETKSFKFPKPTHKNLLDAFSQAVHDFPNRNCAGKRRLIKVHQVEEGGKTFEKMEFENEYTWLTYREYFAQVKTFGAGLHKLASLAPAENIVIYAETQMEWMMSALGALQRRLQVVTVYATLGGSGAAFAINQTRASVVVADAKLLSTLASVLDQIPCVKHVIMLGNCKEVDKQIVETAGITVTAFDEVIALGGDGEKPLQPTSDDIAFIMYTSGTTGTPKGVLLSHANVLTAAHSVRLYLDHGGVNVAENDIYLAYLPLAHIMEIAAEISFFCLGVSLGYGNPHTLTDTGLKLKTPESFGDAVVLQPTVMALVPTLLDKVFQGIHKKIALKGKFAQFLLTQTLENGRDRFTSGKIGANCFWNFLLCRKLQALLGGSVRFMITGSAPLSSEIHVFIQSVFACPLRQGYGLTETAAVSCLQPVDQNICGNVGAPADNACIRLADWEEGNYLLADANNPSIGIPRGEVLVGGNGVAQGYFIDRLYPDAELVKKNEEEFLTIDGIRYFRSGDIGQITKAGTIEIIDRKKDLWKGPNGEYVALAKVENAMKLSKYVEMSMCYGQTGGSYPVALICPSEILVRKFAKGLGKNADASFATLCEDRDVVEEVSKSVVASCKQQKLLAFEIPQKFGLVCELWTPENDMLTAAMKMKRPAIVKKHRAAIDVMNSSRV